MQKIIAAFVSVLIILQISVFADTEMKNPLTFNPVGEGKFIYCNNPEELIREDLADDGETPEYLMNNEGLTEDKYRIYLTHFNRVTKIDESGNTYPGENIWLDAVFTAKTDCIINITRTAFEIPKNLTTYLNYETIQTEDTWSALYACADLIGKPIYTMRTDKVFYPKKQEPYTITLLKGERAFLSGYIDNYDSVPYPKHVLMAADFEIISGKTDLDVFAARNRKVNEFGEISYPDIDFESCGYGIYKRGRTHKGVADSLPEVEASLEYEIGDYTKDGAYLPVTVYNQYYPKGIAVTEWTTNLNPQDDIYTKNSVVETDILPLKYKDESKLGYYGEGVPESEKDDIWIFDTTHSDTMEYPGEVCGISEENYSPNYVLDVEKDNVGYACSLGNYGVTTRYNLKITNNGTKDRYFDYTVITAANVIVEVNDKNGEQLQPVVSKGQTNEITKDVMASVHLPAGTTTEFSVGITLPVQNYGGQRQHFRIRDEKTEPVFKENKQIKPVLVKEDEVDESLLENADERTKFIFEGNLKDFDIIKTDSGFAAYSKVTAGNPWYYGYFWEITGRIFILDNNFCIVKEIYAGSQPIEMSYSDNKIYVKTIANGSFYIDESFEMQPYDSYILPRSNEAATVNAKDNKLIVSLDGEEYYNIAFQKETPPYVALSGNVFYWATREKVAVSSDGIYWRGVKRDINELTAGDGYILVNGDRLSSYDKNTPKVRINDEFLSFDTVPLIKEERVLVPVRYIFEKLGMRVIFDNEKGRIIAVGKNMMMEFTLNSDTAIVNGRQISLDAPAEIIEGRTFVPLRFISENCGFNTVWEYSVNTAVISGEISEMPGDIELGGNISAVFIKNIDSEVETDSENLISE